MLTLWSVALCFIPLLNLLSFEFAFACCLPLSFFGAHCGLRSEGDHIWRAWLRAIQNASLTSVFPLIPIIVNGIWVRNCNRLVGLSYYIILALVTVVISAGYGVWIRAWLSRDIQGTHYKKKNESKGLLIFTVLFVIVLFWGLMSFFFTPSVDVFSTFMGYYPGAIYDEELVIDERLILSRLEDLALIGTALAFIQKTPPQTWYLRAKFWIALLLCLSGAAWNADLHRPSFWVQSQLGGEIKNEHFIVYYPRAWSEERAQALLLELNFNHQELSEFFGFSPSQVTQVYFYHDGRQKKRLMGAHRTLIAKPWQRAIHVHAPFIGDRVITHELAHVFSAEIAPAPHHLSMRAHVIPHMSLIEGLAVAATWTRGRGEGLMSRLSPHQWSAAMKALDLAPPLEQLLQPTSFYGYNSSLAYTMCGSFVRFYGEVKGKDAVNTLYASGGESDDLKVMIERWESWLEQQSLTPHVLQTAKALLNHPSIFSKVCAHELASRRSKAIQKEVKGELDEALSLWRSVDIDAPGDQQSLLKRISLLERLGRREEASTLVDKALKADRESPEPTLSHLYRLRIEEWAIDLNIQTLSKKDRRNAYLSLAEQSLDRPTWRRLAIKAYAYKSDTPSPIQEEILTLLSSEALSSSELRESLTLLTKEWPESGVIHYLLARNLFREDELNSAVLHLNRALTLGLPHHSLTFESLRLQAQIAFQLKDYVAAEKFYDQLSLREDLHILGGEKDELLIWMRRARLFERSLRVQTERSQP